MPMMLNWNEIKDRALRFSQDWHGETRERAEAATFWNAFFEVFGITRRRLASFEAPVKQRKDGGRTATGFIDLFWKGVLIVEHKSFGRDLDRAFEQALEYFPGIPERDLPRFILVSDFAQFRLFDLESSDEYNFPLLKLHENVRLFGFMLGLQTTNYKEQDPANIIAAERMGKLHDQMLASGYHGHALERYLVRLLFCLFSEDTSIFERRQFQDFIELQTREDGSDLASQLDQLFYILNTPKTERVKNIPEALDAFPYVNGALFEERLSPAGFDRKMRESLLVACGLDWSKISPAIFGALFQSIMDVKARRNLGAHYTSEKNILKLIGPLFLDQLRAEFAACKSNRPRLANFHSKIARLKFLDPACGCGNFLVITYRELRLLELDVLKMLYAKDLASGQSSDVELLVQCDVDQFYGIEIEEFPAQIAQVALWLTDHQMNLACSEAFGQYFRRLPLKKSAKIVHGNALRVEWGDVVELSRLSYILGNPPFVGHHYQDARQKQDQALVLNEIRAHGVLDYVCNWYIKAANILIKMKDIRCAFVSTNSITQGEQAGLLWSVLLAKGIKIQFAHRTFHWANEASGQAAVHCVIVGFGLKNISHKVIFDYQNLSGDPIAVDASNINPYLVDAPDIVLSNRLKPICQVPSMLWGNKPTDGGNLILSADERDELLQLEPAAAKYIRRYAGGGDFIKGDIRYCLWLADVLPKELLSLPNILARVSAVKKFRLASTATSTREYSRYPTLFRQIAQPESDYLAVPEVSSERRNYIPIAFFSKEIICSNTVQFIPEATTYHFGNISSAMHMAWVRTVCGRLESRYRYSNSIVYNNYPWPESSPAKKHAIEEKAQAVLDARAQFSDASLADLYDPVRMPPALTKAHQALDRAVDAAYGFKGKTDAERVAFLFALYQTYTSLLPEAKSSSARRKIP